MEVDCQAKVCSKMSRALCQIAVQLDYYMSAQFAGIALACRRGGNYQNHNPKP